MDLPCTYDYPRGDTYIRGEWYEEKSGRVREHSYSDYLSCSLKIDKLSDEHSGVHYFRFYTTLHMSWITGSSGVTLSVTGTLKYIKSITWITFQDEAFMNAYLSSQTCR